MDQKTGPRDIFLHLLSIISLYITVGSFIALIFQYINSWMPDPLREGYYYISTINNSIRWSISILIVMFPVYAWTVWFMNKGYKIAPEKMEMKSRKWLVYLTVFLAALLMIGDLVVLVYNLLRGEFTTRFLLKILTVLLTSGAVFAYYLWQAKGQPNGGNQPRIKILTYSVIGIVAAAIIAGFFIVGSPQAERAYQFDDQRTSDLQMIQGQIFNFWQGKQKLPNNLAELKSDVTGFNLPNDPESGTDYEYKKTGDLSFEICANYNKPNRSQSAAFPEINDPYYREPSWTHEAGRTCFARTIDPDLLPPLQKPII